MGQKGASGRRLADLGLLLPVHRLDLAEPWT